MSGAADRATSAEASALDRLAGMIQGVVWEVDRVSGQITFVSERLTDLLGYTRDEWVDRESVWPQLLHPDERDDVVRRSDVLTDLGEAHSLEYRLRHADGRYVWIRDLVTPVRQDGQVRRVGGVMLDITAQKKAEEDVRAARDRFEKMFAVNPVGTVLLAAGSGEVMEVNDAFLALAGVERSVFLGTSNDALHLWVHPGDRAELMRLMALGPVRQFETQLRHQPSGEIRDVLISSDRLTLDGGPAALVLMEDNTDRKHAEAASRASDGRFRALVQNSKDLITVLDAQGVLTYVSPCMETMLGHAAEHIVGRNLLEYIHPDERRDMRAQLRALLDGGSGTTAQRTTRFRRADGEYRWMEWVATNHQDDPHVRGVVVNSRDVTERKLADEALEESRRTFELLFDASPDGILLVDFTGDMRVLNCNEAAAHMRGAAREDVIGRPAFSTLMGAEGFPDGPLESGALRARLLTHGRLRMDAQDLRGDGAVVPLDLSLALLNLGGREVILSVERDLSDRRAADEALRASQERLMTSEKLAGLGRLTAGLAHEINTPLASTMNELHEAGKLVSEYRDSVGNAQVTDADHREIARELQGVLDAAVRNLTRIGDFIRKMRSHTRNAASGREHFDAVRALNDTLTMLAHEARAEKVDLLMELPREAITITGEQGRFTQIVTNLVVNALHACTPGQSVTVRVATHAGDTVLEVEDTGSGIPAEVLPRIFEPMFTTKEVGKGTGLGLSIIHDIVTGHFGGRLAVDTELGRGTLFRVHFPQAPVAGPSALP